VLQRVDVPAAYRFVSSGELSNAVIESQRNLTAAQVRSYGRIDGFDSQFTRPSRSGTFNLGSEVVLFKSAAGVRGYYHLIVNQDLQRLRAFPSLQHSTVAGLGDENIVLSFSAHSSPSAPFYTTTLVALRRGVYLEYLSTVDPGKKANPGLAVTLLRRMDRRVQHAH
jgi:hypothetical protein